MSETILLGRGRELRSMPWQQFSQELAHAPQHVGERLAFMTKAHHQVRYFVVREIAQTAKPVAPTSISQALDLSLSQVHQILADLEKHLFFLFRNEAGAVEWAYPVTAAQTTHRIRFKSGDSLYAA